MIDPSPDPAERARSAVAVACLRWLAHTGPRGLGPAAEPDPPRRAIPDLTIRFRSAEVGPAPPKHPLWDRWLDG